MFSHDLDENYDLYCTRTDDRNKRNTTTTVASGSIYVKAVYNIVSPIIDKAIANIVPKQRAANESEKNQQIEEYNRKVFRGLLNDYKIYMDRKAYNLAIESLKKALYFHVDPALVYELMGDTYKEMH